MKSQMFKNVFNYLKNNNKSKKKVKKNGKNGKNYNILTGGGIVNVINTSTFSELNDKVEFIFLDNENKNFIGINNIDGKILLLKIEDSVPPFYNSKEFANYWLDKKLNQIVNEVKPNNAINAFQAFDSKNSLTSECLNRFYEKLKSESSKRKIVCFWDWDRTITMEEGLLGLKSNVFFLDYIAKLLKFNVKKFQKLEITNTYDTGYLDVILYKYMSNYHNKNRGIYGAYTLSNEIETGQFTEYLLGGKDRMQSLKRIFELDNVLHCIISNNNGFNIYDEKNKILLIRGIFHEMGLNSETVNKILLLHCGNNAESSGGYNKSDFINFVNLNKNALFASNAVSNLKTLSNYRIYQINKFLKSTSDNNNSVNSVDSNNSIHSIHSVKRTSSAPNKFDVSRTDSNDSNNNNHNNVFSNSRTRKSRTRKSRTRYRSMSS
jgi:hypothetical protein